MSHMVIYRGADGKPGYHQTDDIHDAVSFVEQMRNDEGVEHARIFRLEEVVFEYRPYYRVELQGSAPLETISGGEARPIDATTTAEVGAGNVPANSVPANNVSVSNVPANNDVNLSATASAAPSEISNGEDASIGGPKRGLFGR